MRWISAAQTWQHSIVVSRETQRLETRRRIYDSALTIFRRDGVDSCRMDDIAAMAGVSRGAFYFHFPTKEHVLLERMRETEDAIRAAIDALPADTPIDRVLATQNRSLAAIWDPDPKLLPDVVSAALRFTAVTMHDPHATPLRSALATRFRKARERGEIVSGLPPEVLSDVYLGNTLGGLLAWYGNQALPLVGILDAVTELFWDGARAKLSIDGPSPVVSPSKAASAGKPARPPR
jgi:AcrR family transcriptional regulator